ncbi:MAG: type III pantothenate kinase, partial [Gammaproteobacteria bacterium]
MKFLVDIGNSRIKWAQYRHNSLRSCDACAYDKGHLIGSIDPYWRELSRPTQVFVSNVAGDALATEISAYVDKIWSMTPIYLLVDKEAAGVINGYDDSSQLGIDRWLAMIAARASYQSALCIVDCGTALTVDVI